MRGDLGYLRHAAPNPNSTIVPTVPKALQQVLEAISIKEVIMKLQRSVCLCVGEGAVESVRTL